MSPRHPLIQKLLLNDRADRLEFWISQCGLLAANIDQLEADLKRLRMELYSQRDSFDRLLQNHERLEKQWSTRQ